MKKKSLPLLVKNALLLVLCGLPGALSNSEVNDLQSTIHQNKATLYPHTTSSVDQELRRNLPGSSSTPKSTQRQHWNTADPLKINTWGSPTQKIQPKEQSEEEDEEDDIEKVTTVHMPTYFSYSTTRRANYRDRSNITNNVFRNKIVSSGRKNQDGEDSYTNNEPRSRIVNNTIKNQDGDASEEDSYSTPATNNGRRKKQDGDGNEEDSYTTTNNEPRSRFMNSRRKKQDGGSDGEDSHTTDITSNEPTMTYSSDILKLNTNRSRTSTRFTSPTTDETPTKYPSSSTSRGSRILTGRRKVNNGEEVSTQSDRFSNLERIQQQLQASTFGPTSTAGLPVRLGQGYHDVEYKVEVRKKPLKKDTEGVSEGDKMSPIVVGGKTGEKQHFIKESKQPESGKMKEPLINETQRTDRPEVLNDKFSTIIDTLSKGNINVPSDKLIKNVTINNEPGTNLLETDNVGGGSKESNEKRDTKGNNDDEVKSGISDVIPVIIKNSVVGEGVSDLVNKTSGFKYPVGDDKTRNESLYLSSTLMTSVNDPQELSKGSSSQDGTKVSQPELESEGANAKIVQSKLSPGLLSSTVGKTEAEKDDLEVKKKAYNLKKPLLPSSGGKVEDSFGGKVEDSIGGKVGDSFEVISKNNSTADDDIIIPYYSSSVPSFTLFNKLNNTRMNEENRTKINELQKTRISSSTSRITSTFSSSSRTNLGLVNNNEEYTTFTSNNLENNIITTSSPMLYGFTSTTPRVNHYFSLRTTTTVQSQPATSAGENLIKQITSFNLRKRPVTYHSPFSVSSTERVQNQSEMVNFNKTYANSEQAYRSGSSMRPSTISKIFPWSTSLQETLTMPQTTTAEITTDDYSDETTTPFTQPSSSRSRISTTAFPNWQESPTTSSSISEDSTNHEASSSTYSIPAATFTSSSTSETPSSSILLPATIESSSKASAPANIEPLSRFRTSSPATIETSRRALSRFESVTPSSQSYSSLSSRTSESPTIIDLLDSSENSTFTMRDVSTSESPSSTSDTISTSEFLPKTSDTKSSEAPSRTSDTGDLLSGIQKTTSEFPPKTSDSTSETGDLEIDIRKTNKTAVFYSSSDSAPTSSYNSSLVETEKYEDGFNSTTWYTFKEDGNSTEDLQFGDADRNNQGWIMKSTTSVSTPVNSSVESSEDGLGSTKLEGEPTVSTFFGGSFGGNLDDISSTSSMSTLRPNETSKWGLNRTPSSNSLRTTSRPHVTSTSRHNTTILGLNSTLRPHITSNSGQNLTSIVHSNLTSTPRPTSPSAQETEDVFDPDDEEIHTTTTFSTDAEYEHGNNEEEDDKTNGSGAQTTLKPSKDNRIVKNGNKSKEDGEKTTTVSSERGNFIMKIPTTTEETPLWTHFWTTDVDDGKPTTVPKVTEIPVAATSSPPPAEKVRPLATTGRPIRPVTIEPDLATSPPQYMGLALLVKGATLQEICDEQESLKKAIIFLFRNATGRTLYEDQIAFPSLTANECEGPRKTMNGFHNIDLVLYDENGNFDEELNTEFRMLWERNGLRTKIAIHDVYLILRPSDDVQTSTMTIAVIVISCIGLACLLLFFILMMILRKRQKKFNYGQRCTPVSLDDYSLDNISVYNSMRRKNTRRASKRSYGNPAFDDPSAPSHQMNFAALAHFSTNRTAMDDEFSEIPMVNAKMDELLPGAETRNRYANVIPLPETRVQLAVREGDDPVTGYINANYVKGPKGASKFYIACQAPMQSTVNDFWRMVWEQQSKLILMLTDLHENGVEKCFDYLPPSEVLDCHRLFGDYQVTLKKREVKEKYVISHLQLKNLDSNLWREVTHLWYTSWPHQGVPSEATSIIAYLIEARAHMRNTAGPHIVHCSPGVGRTGTVLAIDLCIREFETSRMVDVPKTVYGLRRNRAGCVQTKDQYAFIYTVLNVYGTKLTGGALDSM